MNYFLPKIRDQWHVMALKDKLFSGITAALIILFLVFLAFTASGRIGLLVVKSSSMLPHVSPGSLLVFQATGIEEVIPGDTVVFHEDNFSSVLVAHRVVEKILDKGKPHIRTKGDSNHRTDTTLIGREEIMGRAVCVIPVAGYILAYAKTPIGLLVLNLLLALFILLLVIDKVKATERARVSPDSGMLVHPSISRDNKALDIK